MKLNYQLVFSILFHFLFFSFIAKAQNIVLLQRDKPTNIRGLSVVNDKTAWISGSNGYIAITNSGGKKWDWQQIRGYENSEFRDIEAFSDKEALIMSSGTPSIVLKTIDGGKSWQEKYRKTDSLYFFDAMDFADAKHGYILGDPIKNKFLLMETKDGGETWTEMKNAPDALPGEAAFAASGTCLRVSNGLIYIVTGGTQSRMLVLSTAPSVNWRGTLLPFAHTKPSQGAFSMASDKTTQVFMGGDYADDKRTDSVAYYCNTNKILTPQKNPAGFQSCVEYINDGVFLSTGTPGSNITTDGGKTWKQIDANSFNVCRKAKRGKLVLLAGNGGKIAILKM
jgi:photosystem II stability/assembly factor-like uncharacterized protein